MTAKSKILGLLLSFIGPRRLKPTDNDRDKLEFKSSTQKIGVSNTEKTRNTFRHRWLKKS